MSLLYKDIKDIKYDVDIKKLPDGKIIFEFSCDGGKFGTDELIAVYELTAKELLDALAQRKKFMKEI